MTQLIEALYCRPEGRGVDFWCHWHFSLIFFLQQYEPEVDSASNSSEYRNISWKVKVFGA
jgi:hypothetical protein